MSDTNNKPKPIYQKRLPGGISAAVFENIRDDRTYRSVNIQRSYRKDGEWNRSSIYLSHEQIPLMIEALKSSWDFLNGNLVVTQSDDSQVADLDAAA